MKSGPEREESGEGEGKEGGKGYWKEDEVKERRVQREMGKKERRREVILEDWKESEQGEWKR